MILKTAGRLTNMFTEKTMTGILNILLIAQFIILFYYTVGLTGKSDINSEYIVLSYDTLIVNTIMTTVAIAGILVIRYLYSAWHRFKVNKVIKINMEVLAIAVSIIVVLLGIYWVNISATVPFADSEGICIQANKFNQADFSGLNKGEYVGLNPHQLGIITFLRLLFKLFGENNFKIFQYFNALMAGVFCYSSYRIVKCISGNDHSSCLLGLLFISICAPMYLYIPFVYGEISSTAILCAAAWMLLEFEDDPRVWRIALTAILCGAAVQLRANSLIIVIGFLIVTLVRFITNKSKWLIIMALSILAGIICFNGIISLMYKNKTPQDSRPIPSVLYVAMGMMQFDDNQGWFNGYNYNAFLDHDCNTEEAIKAGKNTIKEKIDYFIADPAYAREFYTKKLVKQWEAPMFQAVFMNKQTEDGQTEFAKSVYEGTWNARIFSYMNIYQILVYGGVLILMIVWRKKRIGILNYALVVGVFGGLLFSIIWEAKARYVLPYFLMLLPYAATGIVYFCDKIILNKIPVLKKWC